MRNPRELVFVSTSSMGHILSLVQLAKLILQKTELITISIYIITTPPRSYAKINSYLESESRHNPYPTRLTFLAFPPLSNPIHPSTSHTGLSYVELHKPLVKQALEDRVKAGGNEPVGFLLHMFCIAMVDVANALHVPSYVFFTSGANLLNFQFYVQSLVDDHGVDVLAEFNDPGFTGDVLGFNNSVPSKVIPSIFLYKGPWFEPILDITRRLREIKGILVNTYAELESVAVPPLLNGEHRNVPPVYPVGPIIELDNRRLCWSDDNVEQEEELIEWLDGQPKSSVVFLCFGSLGRFDEEQVKELAKGLERSGCRFLWSLRKQEDANEDDDHDTLEVFLKSFIDRTCHRGKIIGWAPQVVILGHGAIGGFVTHCGWNSILESLWFGVPMAAWPMYAEQQLNAFMLLKDLELAVEIRMDYRINVEGEKGNVLVTALEIEKGVRNLMNMDEEMRGRVKKISDDGKKALNKGEWLCNWLRDLIEDAN